MTRQNDRQSYRQNYRRRAFVLAAATALVAGYSHHAQGQTFNVSWIGSSNGLYSAGANWSGGVMPNNNVGAGDFFNVTINRVGGTVVTLNADPTLLNLTIGANAGNQLLMGDARTLTLIGAASGGAIALSNAGTLNLGSTAAATATLFLNGTSANISGAGTIGMFGNSVLTGTGTVTSNNTIIGTGSIGQAAIAFINNGIIRASGGTLALDGRASGGFDNNGTLEALPNGTMVFSGTGGGSFTNVGANINANGIDNVQRARVNLMNDATIFGGTINSNAFGLFFIPGGNSATLNTVVNNADVNLGVGGTLNLVGSIANNNRMRVNVSAGVGTIYIGAGTVTLDGPGTLFLSQQSTTSGVVTGSGTLVNSASHTIAGAGTIGSSTMHTINFGLIDANVAGTTLTLLNQNSGTGFGNHGTIRASAGGLHLDGGVTIFNSGGVIDLQSSAGMIVDHAGFTQIGTGQVNIASASRIDLTEPGATLRLTAGVQVNNAGLIDINEGATLRTENAISIANNGSVVLGATGSNTVEVLSGVLSLTGSGTVQMLSVGANISRITGAGTLNNVSNTIQGEGNIGNNTLAIVNAGTIVAASDGTPVPGLVIDPGPGGMVNSGTITQVSNTITTLQAGAYNNAGGRIISTGSNGIRLDTGVTITGGTLSSTGFGEVFVPSGDSATIASLANTGNLNIHTNASLTIQGAIQNIGTINVAGGDPLAGNLVVSGAATLSGGGVVAMFADADVADVLGTGTLVNIDNTIHGAGRLGNNAIAIVNSGTIVADGGTGKPLTLDVSPAGLTNTGALRSTASSLLSLIGAGGGEITNTAGTIDAQDGVIGLRDNVVIHGGTFLSSGVGNIQVGASHHATVDNATLAPGAKLTINGNGSLTLGGTFQNDGTIGHLPGAVDVTILEIPAGTTTFNGAGVLQMGSTSGFESRVIGAGTLVNSSSHTIVGAGSLGNNTVALRNSGTIHANDNFDTLRVDPGVGVWTNTGTMLATNSGILELNGTGGGVQLGNTGGRIIAGDASNVRLNGVLINGGSITSGGSGTVSLTPASSSTIEFLHNSAPIVVQGGRTLKVGGNVTNTGTILIAPGAGETGNVEMLAGSTLTNNGTIALRDFNGISSIPQFLGSNAVLNNNGLITGDGSFDHTLGADTTFTINNNGAIVSDGFGMGIGAFVNPPQVFVINNAGVFRVNAPGGNTSLGTNVVLSGSGTIDVQTGGVLSFGQVSTPATTLNGGWAQVGNPASLGNANGTGSLIVGFSFIGGPIPGDVTVNHLRGLNAVAIQAGTLTTTAGGGSQGTSFVEGTLTIGALGPARWNLNDNDLVLDYAGASALVSIQNHIAAGRNGGSWNGTGLVSDTAKNNPQHNTTLGAIEASDFIAATGTTTFSGQSVDATSVLVKYTYYGDTDLNGIVNFDDYSRTDAGFNNNRTGWFNGDFDYSGGVNFDDYALLDLSFNTQGGVLARAMSYLEGYDRSSRGMDTPELRMVQDHFAQFGVPYATSFLNAVPEPTTITLLSGLAASAASRRRRRTTLR